jgi:GDP-L-fucose synthase
MAAMIRRFHEAKQTQAPSVTCWGSGSPLREFLHADDLASAALFCLEHWQPAADDPIQHLNVGTGVDLSIKELAELVARTVGYEGEILWDASKPDGTPKKQLDVSRLAALGWRASINLSDGLMATYSTYQDQ